MRGVREDASNASAIEVESNVEARDVDRDGMRDDRKSGNSSSPHQIGAPPTTEWWEKRKLFASARTASSMKFAKNSDKWSFCDLMIRDRHI